MKNIIIVDMQKGFMKKTNHHLIEKIKNYLKQNNFDNIFFTKCVNDCESPYTKLLNWNGITKEEVSHIYLAGGFGFKLDCSKAIQIGMLPQDFADKIETVGNSSLGGAVKFLMEKESRDRVDAIGSDAQEINLSADKDFNQLYMDAMYFEEL